MNTFKNLLLALIVSLILFLFWITVILSRTDSSSPYWQLGTDCTTDNKKNFNNELLVWPEQLHSDRILEQLQLTKVTDAVKKIHITHNSFQVSLGRKYFKKSQCHVDQCEFVSDIKSADAVVFKDLVQISREDVSAKQVWVLYILESPFVSGHVRNDEPSVNWTATYREDSDLVTPYEKWVPHTDIKAHKTEVKNYAAGKTKQVAWFVSNCAASNARLEYAKELQKYIDVDIYGRCGTLKCNRATKQCDEMLDSTYKFYLAFENANCRDYISEKFFNNGLRHNIIPIVMGAHPDDYRRVAPKHSFIHVDNFPSPKDLADYLSLLDADDELYNMYFQWKGTGEFINTKFFCRLCAMLHQNRPPKTYKKFRDWWAGDRLNNICREGGWT